MEGHPPDYPLRLYVALVVGAIGLALIAVGITGPAGWALIVAGFVALILAAPVIWTFYAASSSGPTRRARSTR